MRRFISYIYHYADGTYKCGNVGFCKVEQQGGRRVVNLFVKDVKPLEGKCTVSILVEGGKGGSGGKVYTRYSMDKELVMSGGVVNEKISIDEGDGLLLQCGDRKYVVLWKDAEETISIVEKEIKIEEKVIEVKKEQKYNEPARRSIVHKDDKKDKTEYQRLYNRFSKSRIIIEDREYQVVKLKPQDIMWFPRNHWRLINNSLVMDGYYRYGHILFLLYEGRYALAVPGLDSEKTNILASKCGFEERKYGCEVGKEDVKRPYWFKFL